MHPRLPPHRHLRPPHLRKILVRLARRAPRSGREVVIHDGPALKKAYLEFDDKLRGGDKSVLYPIVLGSGDGKWPVVLSVAKISCPLLKSRSPPIPSLDPRDNQVICFREYLSCP
ncbi:hypothetical protein BDZ45DRAFT_50287 [Acephala macrosclerotiorum]|nr:hypothetical protein BDZ45DRAFT_50287 [Acephala macrosclerotiorum]